jgi:hypothetical protein
MKATKTRKLFYLFIVGLFVMRLFVPAIAKDHLVENRGYVIKAGVSLEIDVGVTHGISIGDRFWVYRAVSKEYSPSMSVPENMRLYVALVEVVKVLETTSVVEVVVEDGEIKKYDRIDGEELPGQIPTLSSPPGHTRLLNLLPGVPQILAGKKMIGTTFLISAVSSSIVATTLTVKSRNSYQRYRSLDGNSITQNFDHHYNDAIKHRERAIVFFGILAGTFATHFIHLWSSESFDVAITPENSAWRTPLKIRFHF